MIKNKRFALLTLVIFVIEVLIATVFKHSILRPVFGDFLVVILMYSFIRAISNKSPLQIGISVLIFSYVVEFSQYIKILDILGIQKTRLTNLILGSSFDWYDILAYTLGVICVVVIDKRLLSK